MVAILEKELKYKYNLNINIDYLYSNLFLIYLVLHKSDRYIENSISLTETLYLASKSVKKSLILNL